MLIFKKRLVHITNNLYHQEDQIQLSKLFKINLMNKHII